MKIISLHRCRHVRKTIVSTHFSALWLDQIGWGGSSTLTFDLVSGHCHEIRSTEDLRGFCVLSVATAQGGRQSYTTHMVQDGGAFRGGLSYIQYHCS